MGTQNICMYKKTPHDTASIKSGDHIFLAAIGGIQKLDKSYVSHEVNNKFSLIEKRFARDYIIAIPRQFEGPGKRGSLQEKHATKSNVCILIKHESTNDSEKYMLGYNKLGKPYILNQYIFKLDSGEVAISIDPYSVPDGISPEQYSLQFTEKARIVHNYISIYSINLPNNIILFGEYDKKWFLAMNNEGINDKAIDILQKTLNMASFEVKESYSESSQVEAKMQYKFNITENYRIVAKMVFNLLAFEMGIDFILKEQFDPIRNWILTGEGENSFVNLINTGAMEKLQVIPLPEKAHSIFIVQSNNELYADVSFYGGIFKFMVRLATLTKREPLLAMPIGRICDWQKNREYTLIEYINEMQND